MTLAACRTFAQWRDDEIARRVAEYGCTATDAAYGIRAADWWSGHVSLFLRDGGVLPLPVCRSLVEHGYNLAWINKFYEGSVPMVDIKTGKRIVDPWKVRTWSKK